MTLIYILLSVSIALNVYLFFMFNGLKHLVEEIDSPKFNIVGDSSISELKYEYTSTGIVFYDKTGKKTLIKGESL